MKRRRNNVRVQQSEQYGMTVEDLLAAARGYEQKGDFARAEELARKAIERKGCADIDLLSFIASILLTQAQNDLSLRDKLNESIGFYKKALQLSEGKDPNLLRALAYAYIEQGTIDPETEDLLLRARMHQPDDVNVLYLLGIVYQQTRRFAEARFLMNKVLCVVLKGSRGHIDILSRLADIEEQDGHLAAALSYLRQAAKHTTDVDVQERIDSIRKTVQVRIGRLLDLSMACHLDRKHREDEGICREALRLLDPNNASALNNLGVALMAQCKYDKAVPYLKKAIKANPNDSAHWFNFGYALEHLSDEESAFAAYTKASALDPEDIESICRLAYLHTQCGRFAEASAELEKASRIAPGDSRLRDLIEALQLRESDSLLSSTNVVPLVKKPRELCDANNN